MNVELTQIAQVITTLHDERERVKALGLHEVANTLKVTIDALITQLQVVAARIEAAK